jgi:hypothetical protein
MKLKRLRKLVSLAALSISVLAALTARASDNLILSWKHPNLPIRAASKSAEWFASDFRHCTSDLVSEITLKIWYYDQHSALNQLNEAKGSRALAQKLVQDPSLSSGCRKEAQALYTFLSIQLPFSRGKITERILSTHSSGRSVRTEYASGRVEEIYFDRPYINPEAYLFAQLYRANKIRFARPLLVQATNRVSTQKSPLLGAYHCQTGEITLDPSLEPYNLRAVFVHELDHWFRDKAEFLQLNSPHAMNISNVENVFFDEFFASLSSSAAQVNLKKTLKTSEYQGDLSNLLGLFIFSREDRFEKPGHTRLVDGRNLKDDLNFYSPRGNLSRAVGDFQKSKPDPDQVRESAFSIWGFLGYLAEHPSSAPLKKLFKTIESAYFDSPTVDPVRYGNILQQNWKSMNPGAQALHSPDALRLFDQLKDSAVFDRAINSNSLACERFIQAIDSGELKHYLGSGGIEFSGGTGGGHTGNDGGRPDRYSTPCALSGMKL